MDLFVVDPWGVALSAGALSPGAPQSLVPLRLGCGLGALTPAGGAGNGATCPGRGRGRERRTLLGIRHGALLPGLLFFGNGIEGLRRPRSRWPQGGLQGQRGLGLGVWPGWPLPAGHREAGESWQPSAAGSGASDPGERGGNRGVPRRERASRGRRGWDWGAWLPATLGPDGANSWRRSAGAWARAAAPSGQRVGAESRPGAGRGGWLVEGWPAEVRLEPGSQGSRPGLGSKATSPAPRAQGLF